jgi:hypothetical protein
MQTQETIVCVDAPAASGERAAAAAILAMQLREELLGSLPRKSVVDRPPMYRLVHHPGSHRPREERGEPEQEQTHRYMVLGAEEVRRLQRLAHLLASLSGELNLWLASVAQGDEEVEP